MTTRHTFTSLLLFASLAVAAPALAQPDPCRQLATPGDLARLGERVRELAQVANLAALDALAQLPDMPTLMDLPDLSQLHELGQLRGVPRGRALSRLHALQRRAESRRSGPQQTEQFRKTFRVGRGGSLYLANISGDVTVKAGTGDSIAIDATKRVPQGADAQQQLNAVTIEATQQGSRVEVRTRYPERGGNIKTSVDYVVTVPPDSALDLHSVSGDIQVTAVTGGVHIEDISGDIRVEGANQIEQLKTVSGDITVVGGAGTDVRVSNITGDLTLRNVKVRSLDISTVSGEAKLTEVVADRAAVKTMSGGVNYEGPFAHGGRYEFTAHSGDVRLVPTSNTGFEIDARTFSGDVRSDVPLTLRSGELPQRHARRELKGTYGDGSALVTVHTFNGDVIVVKK